MRRITSYYCFKEKNGETPGYLFLDFNNIYCYNKKLNKGSNMKKNLRELSSLFGPSGYEDAVKKKVHMHFKRFGLKVKTDKIGNIWGILKGKTDKTLMIEAHMDEIALMVSYFEGEGFVRFSTVGGFDPKIFPGTEVTIYGKTKVKGVITSIPPHLQTGDRKKSWAQNKLFIDTALSRKELQSRVRIGDYISLPKNFVELKNKRIAGTSFDNRIGVTLLLEILKTIKRTPEFTVVFAATFGEEIGLRGGTTSSYSIKPEIGLCLDVSFGDYPGQTDINTALGKGPILSIGPAYHPMFLDFLKNIAKVKKIKTQVELEALPGGTNAGPIQLSNTGVPVAGISIPIRNMHSPVEVVDLNDMQSAVKLINNTIYKINNKFLEKLKCY